MKKNKLHIVILFTLLILPFSNEVFAQKPGPFSPRLKPTDSQQNDNGKKDNDKSPYTKYRKMNMVKGAKKDIYGNAKGNDYDLAKDDGFKGLKIAVLHLYTGENFDFKKPESALKQKGFSIIRWQNTPPSPSALRKTLKSSCQLWIISDRTRKLNAQHLQVIKNFFNEGKGVYIWGDNAPYYADANYVANELVGVTMKGNTMGDKKVTLQGKMKKMNMGLLPNHDITTGIEQLYEGITIATIQSNYSLKPLIYGSSGNLVAAIYQQSNKRLIIDGGFTRLFVKWDTAGTGRYVKNAAAWLVNYDRFGDLVFKK